MPSDFERIYEKILIEIANHQLPVFTEDQVKAFLERLMFFYRLEHPVPEERKRPQIPRQITGTPRLEDPDNSNTP